MAQQPDVTRNDSAHRFEIDTAVGTAVLNYVADGDRLSLVHTEVPAALEGGGYGSALARAALDYARANGLGVVPSCPFVATYLQRHPEYNDLVVAG